MSILSEDIAFSYILFQEHATHTDCPSTSNVFMFYIFLGFKFAQAFLSEILDCTDENLIDATP